MLTLLAPSRWGCHLWQVITGIAGGQDVDLNDLIQAAREDRMCLVQHTSQYKFAHEACVNFAKRHVTADDGKSGNIYALATTKRHLESIDKDPRWQKTRTLDGKDAFVLDLEALSPVTTRPEDA